MPRPRPSLAALATLALTAAVFAQAPQSVADTPATARDKPDRSAQPAPPVHNDGPGTSLTVYSSADPAGFDPQQYIAQQNRGYNPSYIQQVPGFGVVKTVRPLKLTAGNNTVKFTDVAQFIDPTTVSFTDLTDPGATSVLDQQFQFDLVSPRKLLEKYVDQNITAIVPHGDGSSERITGTLLSANQGQLVMKTGDGVRLVPQNGQTQVQLGDLPGGLITRPTLLWHLDADDAGTHMVRTTYQTDGLTWRADYNLILDADETTADLGAWVTLLNLSGASYPDTQLKLIAGDVQRVQPKQPQVRYRMEAMRDRAAGQTAGFEEKSFFEYHLYTLPRKTDVSQNSTQQITLFPTAHGVKVHKLFVYYGLPQAKQWSFSPNPQTDRNLGNKSNDDVDVYVRFQNKKNNKLGIPLPAGKVRVYKADPADGSLEFIGEDLIDHTPKDEKVLIKVGHAFDIVGERTQTDFTVDSSRRTITESIKIELRNHKKEAVDVLVRENLYRWVNWQITAKSDDYEKVDSRTIHFPVTVPANGKKVVTYTVKYTW